MNYTPIIGTLGYILSPDRTKTLLIHRNARENDAHRHKYNGLGGKMHPDEDVVSCMKREILEEAGISCEEILLRGTINWTGFGPDGGDWLGFIFRIDRFSGTPRKSNNEGTLLWHAVDRLNDLPMWEGDKYFLPLVFDDDLRQFHGHMPYKDGSPLGWNYSRI
ncbi:MAG: 8-oxo-dGTP diphosphatase [Proteobacteria bacterium]|nr:8-oxo-dGTP diphosphatase [Pseudomonadota bacterium]MBU1708826.1 8-oxo-dGTP diphosphatase [Pseudomonadota bacterium]